MQDQLIIRLCSPTLAGIKTGSLFTVGYTDRKEFNEDVRSFNHRMKNKGLRMIPVKYTEDYVLVYLYRPLFLKRDFKEDKVRQILKEKGYSYTNSDLCVAELARRLEQNSAFPHEIGVFLGYPADDVRGFMNSPDSGYKYVGYWKVYGDMDAAIKLFTRFSRCTEKYVKRLRSGSTLEQLAVNIGPLAV